MDKTIETIKRKAYFASAMVGGMAVIAAWGTHRWIGDLGLFERMAYPLVAAFCAWVVWAVGRGRYPLPTVERVAFYAIGLFYLGEMTFALYERPALPDLRPELVSSIYWTLLVLCIMGFIVHDFRNGLLRALVLYGATIAFSWVGAAGAFGGSPPIREAIGLIQLQFFSGAAIALLCGLAYSKAQFARVRSVADEMTQLAQTDPLTHIFNRRWISELLVREIEQAGQLGRPLALILFDVDFFKRINDTFGHPTGDSALAEVARLVRFNVRQGDLVGRWGGEEFLIICPATDARHARDLAERLRRLLENYPLRGIGTLTASFGVAAYRPGERPEGLVKRADESLYRAKTGGRNRVETAR